MDTPEIFISYVWKNESLTITEALDAFLQARGFRVVRDNRDIGYKGLIKEYMQRLGQGKYIVVVLSDEYFKSPSCMYELLEIEKHPNFQKRIFPVAVENATFYRPEDRLKYLKYWDEEKIRLQEDIRKISNLAHLDGITDDLDLYDDIRRSIARLLDFLRNINTHPLKGSNFEPLLQAIRAKIMQDQTRAISSGEVKAGQLTVTLRRQIVEFFMTLPNIYDPNTVRALIQSASLDSQLLSQISFTGASGQFFQLLLPILIQYGRLQDGRPALQAVLEAAKELVGGDRKGVCNNLIRELGWIPSEDETPGA